MRHAIYERMVETINNHRMWIGAECSNRLCPDLTQLDGIIRTGHYDAIVLTAYRPDYGYKVGQQWIIPESKLNRSVRELKREDEAFANRFRTDTLTLDDVERIIKQATFGLVNLNLDEYEY